MISNSELYIVDGLNKGVNSCSLLFNFFSIFIYLKYLKQNRNYIRIEILIWLIVVNSLLSIPAFFPSYLVTDKNINTSIFYSSQYYFNLCLSKTMLYIFFSYSQSIICCIIGYTALLHIIKPEHIENRKIKFKIIFSIISFIIPLSMIIM